MFEMKLSDIGEKRLVSILTDVISPDPRSFKGLGHDSGFLDIAVSDEDVLMVNTDRSGVNVAYSLGIANGECIGDFAVSHAVSDIFASGGSPVAVTLALLLPPDLSVSLAREIVVGADRAAKKYGAYIAAGDTKRNGKLSVVATAIGKGRKDCVLTRSGAKKDDLLVVTGALGTMIAGLAAYRKGIRLSERERTLFNDSLTFQNPPYRLARDISSARLANACTDNSDGLASSVHALCSVGNMGARVFEQDIPVTEEAASVADRIGVTPVQLSLASGDWEFLYAVPPDNIEKFMELASRHSAEARVIGSFTDDGRVLIGGDGEWFEFLKIENDRFLEGPSYFDRLSARVSYKGKRAAV